MKKFILCCSLMMTATFTGLHAQTYENSVEKSLQILVNQKIISKTDGASWKVTSENVSSISGVRNIYFRQVLNGLEIYGTESSIHILPDGKILKSYNNFINDASGKNTSGTTPNKTAVQAVQLAATHLNYSIQEPLAEISKKNNISQETTVSKGGFSSKEIPVKLMYQKLNNESIALVWDLSIKHNTKPEWYSVRVNANTGEIVDKGNWIVACNFDHPIDSEEHENHTVYGPQNNFNAGLMLAGSYEVFARPLENPLYGGRSIVTNPDNEIASPYGWHDTNGADGPEFTTTKGNNVNAHKDSNGYNADGGNSLTFHFPYGPNYSASNTYIDASLTNLFYWNNIIHDVLYQYGFDEASGNFQENNYGNGGLGSDSIFARGQIGQECNAYFGTPSDGDSGEMQMYLCGNKDGSFDNLVMVHEYGHGISNRLTGGPANSDCLWNGEQMGEGWSDWYGLMLTMEADDTSTYERGIGTYLFGQSAGGDGIRQYPYTTDMSVNPHTYGDVENSWGPHAIGSIWAAMLWEVTWALIDEYGFDEDIYNGTGGNNIAMALVTEGLRLQPCSPGFVDGRDAILAADEALFDGANQCLIWEAFAKRGLGFSAEQGSSQNSSDGTEAFDVPPTIEILCPEDMEVTIPEGTTYTLPDYSEEGDVSASNLCSDEEPVIVQTPAPGTELEAGTYTIEFEVTDENDNSYTCDFELVVEEVLGVNDQTLNSNISLYPNPTSDNVTIVNKSSTKLKSATVVDTNGRIIQKLNLNEGQDEIVISLKSLPSGVYFIKLNSDKEEIIKSVIKK